jgi:cytidylate kinase
MGLNKGIVMDGRDIGTVVFPDAELKIFLTASSEKRAMRRYKEMTDNGVEISYNAVLENVNTRDLLDTTRKDSPLIKAADAIEIDNSDLNVRETFEKVYKYAQKIYNFNH